MCLCYPRETFRSKALDTKHAASQKVHSGTVNFLDSQKGLPGTSTLYTSLSTFPVPPVVTGQSSPEKGGEDKHVSSRRPWTTEEVPGTQVKHRVQGAIWNRAGRNQNRLEDTQTGGAGLMLARGLDVCVSKGILHSRPMPPREGSEGIAAFSMGS